MSGFFAATQERGYTKNVLHIDDVEDEIFHLDFKNNNSINNHDYFDYKRQTHKDFENSDYRRLKTNSNGSGYYTVHEKQKQKVGSKRPVSTESYEDKSTTSLSSSTTNLTGVNEKYTGLEGYSLDSRESSLIKSNSYSQMQCTPTWNNERQSSSLTPRARGRYCDSPTPQAKDAATPQGKDNYKRASPQQSNKDRKNYVLRQRSLPQNSRVTKYADVNCDVRSSAFEPTRRTTEHRLTNVLTRPTHRTQYRGDGEYFGDSDCNVHDDQRRPCKKREKYMPVEKSSMELYDPAVQIQCGSRFEEMFSLENDEAVHVTGAGVHPPRVQSFKECEYSNEIMKNLEVMNYRSPTQIQKFVMPLILTMKGDVVGHASTGSGKTVAFLAPVIQKIQMLKRKQPVESTRKPPYEPYVIILAPTRELCQQLYTDARRLSMNTGVTTHLSMGDMPMTGCLVSLREGCDVFVATIGRTGHYIRENHISLRKVLFFIMDEVDALTCQNKEKKDRFDVFHNILKQSDLNPKHRTLLFSATLSPETQNKLTEFIRENTYFVYVGEVNRVVETVYQEFHKVEKARKRNFLQELLIRESKMDTLPNGDYTYKPPKTIVFVNEKRMSDRLAYMLALLGFQVISLNADRTLKQRIMAIEKFAKGIYDVLVATDVSSRGMNFPEVDHVINYDLPKYSTLTYVHRLGRSGRVGNHGRATSFFDEQVDKKFAYYYIQELQSANQVVPEFLIEARDAYKKTDYRFNGDHQLNRRDLSDRAWM